MQLSQEQKPIRIGDPPPAVPPLEVVELVEVLGRVVPVDLVAALAGHSLHIVGASS
jgi:hypothetical protein